MLNKMYSSAIMRSNSLEMKMEGEVWGGYRRAGNGKI